MEVSMSMYIDNIANADGTRNEIDIEAVINLSWNTSVLTWSPEEYHSITSIRLPRSKVWVPDITLFNGAHTFENEENVVDYSNGLAN